MDARQRSESWEYPGWDSAVQTRVCKVQGNRLGKYVKRAADAFVTDRYRERHFTSAKIDTRRMRLAFWCCNYMICAYLPSYQWSAKVCWCVYKPKCQKYITENRNWFNEIHYFNLKQRVSCHQWNYDETERVAKDKRCWVFRTKWMGQRTYPWGTPNSDLRGRNLLLQRGSEYCQKDKNGSMTVQYQKGQ